ncbi:MAG: T9SS type A sorting domain-containing protein [Polaribacter sp.]
MKGIAYLAILSLSLSCFSQVTVSEKFVMDNDVRETSGLLVFNNKIITHNDSGDDPKLYELNAGTGAIERVITISNASHIDWEDITMDDDYIYIGDIGNNNGNRTNLKIYKIDQDDFTNSDTVSAEIINFSYEDQTDFTSLPNANNFDAEALTIFDDSLLIFTKNWQDFQTKVYQIPKTSGTHFAKRISSGNVQGLITGATVSSENPDLFFLSGYTTSLVPFLIIIPDNRAPGPDVFNNGFTKVSLENELEEGNQVEGIFSYALNKLYISREKFEGNLNGNTIERDPKLYEITEQFSSLLHTTSAQKLEIKINNPVRNEIRIHSNLTIEKVELFSILGKQVSLEFDTNKIMVNHLKKGLYILSVHFENDHRLTRKIIIH